MATLTRKFRVLRSAFSLAGGQVRCASSYRSVDEVELSHFSALASTWWDPHGPSRLLHLMNPHRHDFISACIASQADPSPPGKKFRYLDIGCGGGIFVESAARLRHTQEAVGVDPGKDVIAVAKAHAARDPGLAVEPGRLKYINSSIEDLPVPKTAEEQFDVLTIFEVIEHVPFPSTFLETCLPFVKPGGWIVMSTIARTWTSWLTTKVVAEDLARIAPRGTHDWDKYINEDELRRWFGQKSDWTSMRASGIMYLPGLGWKECVGGENWGNYFFGVRRDPI